MNFILQSLVMMNGLFNYNQLWDCKSDTFAKSCLLSKRKFPFNHYILARLLHTNYGNIIISTNHRFDVIH